jgi:hypothetical protein
MKTHWRISLGTLVAGGTVVVVLLAGARPVAAEEERWQKAYSLEGISRVSVENINGDVAAKTWDRNYIRVSAVKTGSSSRLHDTLIRVTQHGDEIKVETVPLRRRHHLFTFFFHSGRLARVDYELLVPAATPLGLSDVNGGVHAQGREGQLRVETVNGRVEIQDARGEVHAETVNGRISFSSGPVFHETRLETVNGGIEAELTEGAPFRYRLETVNGSLEVGDRQFHGRSFGGKELEGDFNAGSTLLKAETVNGSIHVSFRKP